MVTDHEAVLARFKAKLNEPLPGSVTEARPKGRTKDSWGRKDLLALIGELEGEHVMDEGLTEKLVRQGATAFADAMIKEGVPQHISDAVAGVNGASHDQVLTAPGGHDAGN